jgi:F0F1-type ATP synthase membrane subunit b/b'
MNYSEIKTKLQVIVKSIDDSGLVTKIPASTQLLTSRLEAAIIDIKLFRLTGKEINDLLVSTLAHIENNTAVNKAADTAFYNLQTVHEAKVKECKGLGNKLWEMSEVLRIAESACEMRVASKQELLRTTRDEYNYKIKALETEIEALKTHMKELIKQQPTWAAPVWQQPYPIQITPYPGAPTHPIITWAHNK